MVDDHTKLGDQMRLVAEKMGVSTPSGTSVADKALATKLNVLSGDTFDKAYIKAMVKDHRTTLASFHKEEATGANAEVKDATKQAIPTIRAHLQLAEKIAKSHNADVSK
jgi:putative membrane protein